MIEKSFTFTYNSKKIKRVPISGDENNSIEEEEARSQSFEWMLGAWMMSAQYLMVAQTKHKIACNHCEYETCGCIKPLKNLPFMTGNCPKKNPKTSMLNTRGGSGVHYRQYITRFGDICSAQKGVPSSMPDGFLCMHK